MAIKFIKDATPDQLALFDKQNAMVGTNLKLLQTLGNAAEILSTLGMDITSIVNAENHIIGNFNQGKKWTDS